MEDLHEAFYNKIKEGNITILKKKLAVKLNKLLLNLTKNK